MEDSFDGWRTRVFARETVMLWGLYELLLGKMRNPVQPASVEELSMVLVACFQAGAAGVLKVAL